jgi:zinc transport system substrate-binding protein
VRIVLILIASIALAGCTARVPGSERTQVVASFYPLAFAAEQVAPGADVHDLTPPGVEPHDLELPPREIERIRDADAVLYLGDGFQPAVEDALSGAQGTTVDLLPHGTDDPHVWLAPLEFAKLVERTARALGGDAGPLVSRLDALDAEYRAGLADCDRRTIVVSHAAFGHLADAYGLTQVALSGLAPEAEAGPRDLERTAEEVRDEGVTTVFVEPLAPRREAETIARETDTELAVLDPIEGATDGGDYFSLMRANLAALRQALGCR